MTYSLTALAFAATLATMNLYPSNPPTEQHAEPLAQPVAIRTLAVAFTRPIPAELDETERHALGQRVYLRSCVNCHGIQPRELADADAQRFVANVLEGSSTMPALGFKLDAAEVELAQAYVALCSRDYNAC